MLSRGRGIRHIGSALRTPRPSSHRTYNRFTGGVERRATLNQPPSRYARSFSSQAGEPEPKIEEETANETPEKEEVSKEQIIARLEEQIAEVKSNWQSALAETDNVTKKMLKDVATTRESAADKLAVNLFPVADTLEFCIRNRPDFEGDENVEAKGAFDGLEAAKRQFVTAMRSLSVNEIVPAVGDEFDPMIHNACFEVEDSPNAAPGQVGLVIKTGWSKGNTLLRAADVGVAKRKECELPLPMLEEDDGIVIDSDDEDNIDSDD